MLVLFQNRPFCISFDPILHSAIQIWEIRIHSTLITTPVSLITTISSFFSSPHHHNQLIILISSILYHVSDPQPPRFIQLPSPASPHITESLICLVNSHSQQHSFSSTPLSTRFSQTCMCLQRHSHQLFLLVNTLFYHTCSWTQSNCMLSLFLFSLY